MTVSVGEQDLTNIGSNIAGRDLSSLGLPPKVIATSYDLAPVRESIRGNIALALVWTLVGLIASVLLIGIVTAYGCHTKDSCTTETSELKTIRVVVEIILTPLVGLVGAVTGFYFGEKSASENRGA